VRIGIIGCGNMGEAIIRGILTANKRRKPAILCVDKNAKRLAYLGKKFGVRTSGNIKEAVRGAEVIVIAVKPQDLGLVLPQIKDVARGKLFISICAGITTKKLERFVSKVAFVRVMPNMPAQVRSGISAFSLGKHASRKDAKVVKTIFSSIGEVVEVKESLMDAVTAISGSGPAYFFFLVETLIRSARQLGISEKIARALAVETALGSALLLKETNLGAKALRKKITSKGGTTEAAFKVFKKRKLGAMLDAGFKAAAKRSKKLSSK
jgi:pyrroline-5-carboxylate reductase